MTETTFRIMHKKDSTCFRTNAYSGAFRRFGADPVMESAQADTTPPYEFSFRSGVEQDSDGNWITVNSVGPVFTEYTDKDGDVQTVDAQTTAYRANVDAEAAEGARNTRTTLLGRI